MSYANMSKTEQFLDINPGKSKSKVQNNIQIASQSVEVAGNSPLRVEKSIILEYVSIECN